MCRHFIQNLLIGYTCCEYTTKIDLHHILTVQLFVVLFLFCTTLGDHERGSSSTGGKNYMSIQQLCKKTLKSDKTVPRMNVQAVSAH